MEAKQVQSILALMHSEIAPALGCTEPAAVALACGKAREILGCIPTKGEVYVSGNVFKNAMGVGIPGTGLKGLPIAVALGLTGGSSSDSLEILKNVDQEHLNKAQELIDNNVFKIEVKENVDNLYIEISVSDGSNTATVIISNRHNHFSYIERNGKVMLDNFPKHEETSQDTDKTEYPLTIDTIFDFLDSVSISDLKIFEQSIKLNKAIAHEGLNNRYGLQVGRSLLSRNNLLKNPENITKNYAMALTTAACDARMGGSSLPVMSNTGSGNQGITASLPVIAFAEKMNVPHEKLIKALAMSHLVAIHMKSRLGSLSALCGIVLAATGSACGITYLKGGTSDAVKRTIKYMGASITGMLCDGAKPACALKVYSGITAAMNASEMAMNSEIEALADGIIDNDIEQTITNIANIGKIGLSTADKMIIDIMQNKKN